MHDLKNKRVFLKRCEFPTITIKDLYIGSIVNVYSRQLKFIDYGDVYTRNTFEVTQSKTLALIKPDAYTHIGKITSIIEQNAFTINNIKMTKLTQ